LVKCLRWESDVTVELGKMKIQNWSKMAMDREAWKRNVEQAKIHRAAASRKEEIFSVLTQMQDKSILRQPLK
jgi:hypothetical protein